MSPIVPPTKRKRKVTPLTPDERKELARLEAIIERAMRPKAVGVLRPLPKVAVAKESIVYFLGGAGLVKIGLSTTGMSRIQAIRQMSPVFLTLLATIPGDRRVERGIHQRFAALRTHGEWFKLDAQLAAFIQAIKEGKTP